MFPEHLKVMEFLRLVGLELRKGQMNKYKRIDRQIPDERIIVPGQIPSTWVKRRAELAERIS